MSVNGKFVDMTLLHRCFGGTGRDRGNESTLEWHCSPGQRKIHTSQLDFGQGEVKKSPPRV